MEGLRRLAASCLNEELKKRLPCVNEEDWRSPILVIAPHPDDETLGCGGTILKTTALGGEAHFVFVTDGTGSHSDLTPAALKAMREREAADAVACLGAGPQNISFLGVPDGAASQHVDAIACRLARQMDEISPRSVFIPHAREPVADHLAVQRAAVEAIARCGARITVFEYPVWYWFHWPWVPLSRDRLGLWRKAVRQSIATRLGLGALRTLNARACVGDVLMQKREALAAHVSQTQRPDDNPDWPVLADVGSGGFLARLMSDCEMFTRYTYPREARQEAAAEGEARARGLEAAPRG